MAQPLFRCPYLIAVKSSCPFSTLSQDHSRQAKSELEQFEISNKDVSDSKEQIVSKSDNSGSVWSSLSRMKALFEYFNLLITFRGSVTVY